MERHSAIVPVDEIDKNNNGLPLAPDVMRSIREA